MVASQAKQVHGAEGDGCWVEAKCHRRRADYRRRAKRLEGEGEMVEVSAPETVYALLYLYQDRADAPLHAIKAELWKGQEVLLRTDPIHCFGYTAGQIRDYSERILKEFSTQSEVKINQFKEQFFLSSSACPIRPCPLVSE